MNLIIDVGNTRTKVAIFNNNELIELKVFDDPLVCDLEFVLRNYPDTKNCIVSVTGLIDKNIQQYLKNTFPNIVELTGFTALPFANNYETKQTQGPDRIAGIAGAQQQFPKSNVLLIDAGTAINYDYIDFEGNYWGGNISAGIEMRFKALNSYTQKLPLLSKENNFELLGINTQQAIISGVQNGVIFEVEGYIAALQNKYTELKVIITGGDADFLAGKLKSPIFVNKNIVLFGLNRILDYNVLE